jgi:putative ABC transport system ATP-binding protein
MVEQQADVVLGGPRNHRKALPMTALLQQDRPAVHTPVAQVVDVSKTYGRGAPSVHALRNVTAAFAPGSFTAIMGPSGSGKSTLLHVAAGLDRPTSGDVQIGDTNLSAMSEKALTRLRRDRIGFVFQAYNLIPSLDVAQNIGLPARLAGRRVDRAWLAEVCQRVGLGDRMRHRPAELSGGQQQRVAIARALVTRPEVMFADEPTGALDSRTGGEILGLMRESVDRRSLSIVMVTHDPLAAARADSVLFLADGRIVDHLVAPTADSVAERMTHLER